MKINICYEIKDGPFGGGNQFLKALTNFVKEANYILTTLQQQMLYCLIVIIQLKN